MPVPVFLPGRRDLLRPPPFHCFCQNLLVLRLTASRISSDPPAPSVSLRQWLDCLPAAVIPHQGWGAMVADQFASRLWLEGESQLSVNHRELLAVRRGLFEFRDLLQGHVAIFCDNTTAVSYLRRQGGTYSLVLNGVAQKILRWAKSQQISLPQFFFRLLQRGHRRSLLSLSGDWG